MEGLFLSNVCKYVCIKILKENQCSHCNIFICAFSGQKPQFCMVVLLTKHSTDIPRTFEGCAR